MTNKHQKKQNDNKNSPFATITGAVLTGVAIAATMVLNDEKTREKVKKLLLNVKSQAIDYVNTLKTELNVGEEIRTIKKIATDTKKVVEK